ncbi:MAG: radical SAM family heme chaperone HemW [Deltaproteobacteria bacterium]|nr:radical SAM family heme chaperone HemW [Deltaproteobacteria bacterium]MBW2612264.1 radical SAM family heme chaperone HemW [Deltaproteobacteria bacterium]MBW2676995.1 radical SAM family heme chaperone HemW [Deltaproteobacteria bacterium]
MAANAGLYIHFPFCVKKCAYCDFYSITDLTLREVFVEALIHEMELLRNSPFTFDTIYLGGGTPSVLPAKAIDRLLSRAFTIFNIQNDAEITIEANPGTVDEASLLNYRQAGINRINLGVQSFSAAALKFLGRIHTADVAVSAIVSARKAGFDNLGLDLIYGIPGQDPASWENDLQRAVDCSPEHLSCYTLTFEKGTPLGKMMAEGRVAPLDDTAVSELFKLTQNFLSQHGYEQYEISNFARTSHEGNTAADRNFYRSRHNQKYWSSAPYIGLGPAAHTFIDPERCWNVPDLETYLSRLQKGVLPVAESETLTTEQRLMETLYLSMRTIDGIDIPRLEETFDLDFHARYADALQELARRGLLIVTDTRSVPTPRGMRFVDTIIGEFI